MVNEFGQCKECGGENTPFCKTCEGVEDKPEYGKQYSLTGGTGDKCISNGNSWAESEVK